MKRLLLTAAVALAGLAVALGTHTGRAQHYPAAPGYPGAGAPLPHAGGPPANPLKEPWLQTGAAPQGVPAAAPGARPFWETSDEGPDPNREFLITSAQGPWVIFLASFST